MQMSSSSDPTHDTHDSILLVASIDRESKRVVISSRNECCNVKNDCIVAYPTRLPCRLEVRDFRFEGETYYLQVFSWDSQQNQVFPWNRDDKGSWTRIGSPGELIVYILGVSKTETISSAKGILRRSLLDKDGVIRRPKGGTPIKIELENPQLG